MPKMWPKKHTLQFFPAFHSVVDCVSVHMYKENVTLFLNFISLQNDYFHKTVVKSINIINWQQ